MKLNRFTNLKERHQFRVNLGEGEDVYDLQGIRHYLSGFDPTVVHGLLKECPALSMDLTNTMSDLRSYISKLEEDLQYEEDRLTKFYKGRTLKSILEFLGKTDLSEYSATDLKKIPSDSLVKVYVRSDKTCRDIRKDLTSAKNQMSTLTEFKADVKMMWESLRSINRDLNELRK